MNITEFTAAVDAANDRDDFLYVCVFCDVAVAPHGVVCAECGDYKGIVTVEEWEDSTGEEWEIDA